MASGFSADTAQLRQLGDQLHAAGVELEALDPANSEAGRVVVAAARPPRRTGALAAGQRADATREGVTFASTARYWTFVHWGAPRRNIRARPWFSEALKASQDRVLAVYAEHAQQTIDKIG